MISFVSSLDVRVLDVLYAYRDFPTTAVLIAISELGDAFFIGGIAACIVLYLLLRRRYAYVAGLIVSVAGSAGATLAIKSLVHRARPDIWYRAYPETGFSFPSAHATLAAALYGFLIFLVWRMVPAGSWRSTVATLLTVLIAAIAFSRMYLGVHYLSDVLAGLMLGATFAYLGTAVVSKMERRG